MNDPGMEWTRAQLAELEAKGLKLERIRSHTRPANTLIGEDGRGTRYYLIVDEPSTGEGHLYVRRELTGEPFFY